MKRVLESEVEGEFERQFCWGDDERYYYNLNLKKASVFGHALRLEEVLKLVDRFSPGKRVADLACAQGNFGLLLAEKGYDVTAIDIKLEFLRYAQKKYTSGQFQVQQANLMDYRAALPFDCILAGEVIEHVAHPEKLLESVSANLKPGGVLILTTPNGQEYGSELPTYSQVTDLEALIPRQFHWGDHLFLYTMEELQGLLELAGFEVLFREKYHSSYVSQLKGIRYLLPVQALRWLERQTRHWMKRGKDSSNSLVIVARKN